MPSPSDQPRLTLRGAELAGIAQLLDEHHLVVLDGDAGRRRRFARALARRLESIAETAVIRLRGGEIRDLAGLCAQVAEGTDITHVASPPGASADEGLIELLRSAATEPEPPPRHQFFIWEDADVLLEADVETFGHAAGAFLAVSAEREHVARDVLVLQRTVLLGGPKLGAYAENRETALRRWNGETAGRLRAVAELLPRPPVLTYRLDG